MKTRTILPLVLAGLTGTFAPISASSPSVHEQSAYPYCTSMPNSLGVVAKMDVLGTDSISNNDMLLEIRDLPMGSFGCFIYGQVQAAYPFGNGVLCISPFHPGLFRLQPVMHATSRNPMTCPVDFRSLPSYAAILPGSTWNFQFIYRDIAAGGALFNTSDAYCVTFSR